VANAPNEKERFFDKPRNVRLVLRLLFAVCAVVFLLDLVDLALRWFGVAELRHAERSWEGLPGFYAIFGFVACVFLVLAAKELRKVVMRDEDYYDG
jgi:hypothetical protein